MKKNILIIFAILLMVSALTGCIGRSALTRQNNSQQQNGTFDVTVSESVTAAMRQILNIMPISNTSAAYAKLMTYKTENYSRQSVADFNKVLLNGNYLEFNELYCTVMSGILPDDENYDFIMLTLSASISEIYCEQAAKNEEPGIFGYVEKKRQSVESVSDEEDLPTKEPIYDFLFNASYYINYTIPDPALLTVAERDYALHTIHVKLQRYIDELSETELMNSNIRTLLADKADEISNSVSTDNIKLSCEINDIEIHDAGREIVW